MNYPWLIPQNLRSDKFHSLYKQHEKFNVVTDFSKLIPWNRYLIDKNNFKIGYADTQINMHAFESIGILGSGRSLFYEGKYLKGIGLTSLAGHWCYDKSGYHSTGAMLASSGIRELMISKILDFSNIPILQSCEGLLLKKDKDFFSKVNRKIFSSLNKIQKSKIHNIDKEYSAITVKNGNFCRYSNHVWLMSQNSLESRWSLHALLRSISLDLFKVEENDIALIFSEVFRFFILGWKNLLAAQNIGLCWGSFNNNFTTQGKFVDLETYTFIGAPFIAYHKSKGNKISYASNYTMGTSHVTFLKQIYWYVKTFDCFLSNQLLQDKYQSFFVKKWIEQAKYVKAAFDKMIKSRMKQLLEKNVIVDAQVRIFDERYDLLTEDRKIIKKIFEIQYDQFVMGQCKNDFILDSFEFKMEINPAEYGKSNSKIILPKFLKKYIANVPDYAAQFNRDLNFLCASKSHDILFNRISDLKISKIVP